MARKVLISFLGTGPLASKETRTYRTANYHLGDTDLGEYPFVSAALKKYYGIDKILLVGTVHSMWEEVYRWYNNDGGNPVDDSIYFSIAEACEKSNNNSPLSIPHRDAIENALGNDSKVVLIKYGINEQEVMENTNIILGLEQYLGKNDELIIDVTHSFRSLPIFIMNLIIYLKNVSEKRINISHIHYGMLEMNKELGYAPLIDLKYMMEVNNWITGAYAFSQFGNAYMISNLIADSYKSECNTLREFSDLMNMNHLYRIQSISQRLSSIKNTNYDSLLPQLTINPIVNSFISRFNVKGEKRSLFQLKVAKWQLEHKKYAQAFLTLTEAMITYVCEKNSQFLKWDDFDSRENAKQILNFCFKDRNIKCDNALKKTYSKLRPLRNCVAHALNVDDTTSQMVKILKESVEQVETILLGNTHSVHQKDLVSLPKKFINFSNHPSSDWEQIQLDAAKDFGEIEDLVFPSIKPENSHLDINSRATQVAKQIEEKGKGFDLTVHIMGEMTFTYAVVSKLKERGIRCVASTTERIVTEETDGKKLSEFSFVGFREY